MDDDDIIEEILVRLPVKSLGRCKCLSKKWHHTISHDLSFRSRLFCNQAAAAAAGPSQFLGFFLSRGRGFFKTCVPIYFCPVSHQGTQLTNTTPNSNRIRPALIDFDSPLSFMGCPQGKSLNLMASSNGFLLCSLQEFRPVDYFLCNPITKQWIPLPTPNCTSYLVFHGLYCDPATCYSSIGSVKFKVVRAVPGVQNAILTFNTIRIEILCSDHNVNEWKVLHLTCPSYFRFFTPKNIPAVVSPVGEEAAFYWPAIASFRHMRSVVVFDPKKEHHLDFIPMPETDGYEYTEYIKYCEGFGQSEGSVVYVRTDYYYCHFEVWSVDNCAREWRLKHKVEIQNSLPQLAEMVGCQDVYPRYKTVAVHPDNSQLIYIEYKRKLVLFDARNSNFSFICDFDPEGWRAEYFFFVYNWPHWPPPVLI